MLRFPIHPAGSGLACRLLRLGAISCICLLLFSANASGSVEPGYIVLKALSQAYPNQIGQLSFRNHSSDWAVKVNETWLNWANGRLLPDSQAKDYIHYQPYTLYVYPRELPKQPVFSPEEEQKFLQRLNRDKGDINANDTFRLALFGVSNKREMDQKIQEIPFLGHRIAVHPMIVWPLKRVEQRLRNDTRNTKELTSFLAGIRYVSTYKWRKMQYFDKLSNHSFGTALDFLPYRWQGKATYWDWERNRREDWYNIPYRQRWKPPQIVIDAFEAEGFVWGGKWLFFDTMHFEYRPELFLLRSYLAERKVPLNNQGDTEEAAEQ